MILAFIGAAQLVALAVVITRLARGRNRIANIRPDASSAGVIDTSVSVVVPARNEAERIGPCLDGLRAQGAPLMEAIIVDGNSTDGTSELIAAAAVQDARIRCLAEPPRPLDSVGRPWAIAAGCRAARGEWVMIVDADTAPQPGMIAGAVTAARNLALDVVSFAPRIVAPNAGGRWLQPAFLTTLVYRFGPAGAMEGDPERVMANGQCLLVRRSVLERAGGYGVVAASYCDDIRIARHLAAHGARVAFLDGPRLLDVIMYATGRETWRSWPRSLNMRDATRVHWRWLDALVLLFAQALPLPMLVLLALLAGQPGARNVTAIALVAVNAALLVVRLLLAAATAHSFAVRGIAYWLAPLADLPAVLRVIATMVRAPREWRGQIRDVAPA